MLDKDTDCTVLIVEDDDEIRDLLAEILRDEGYVVFSTRNGQEAFLHLAGHKLPTLILLDLMMPVMNGWQFREKQQQSPELATIPVVVMSADVSMRERAQKIHANHYLSKPIQLEALLDTIARYRLPQPTC